MLKHLFSDCLVIGAFIFVSLLAVGCGRENIFDMHIEDVEIYVSAIDDTTYRGEPLFLVIAQVTGFAGPTDCYGHHETDYLQTGDYAGAPFYRDGDTLRIHITASGSSGGTCGDAVSTHDENIFLGFCMPGTYTLKVNDFSKTFRVPFTDT